MSFGPLDDRLPADHPARQVWAYVESADLAALYTPIKAVAGWAGRWAIDPQILLSLWLYATLDGVGWARAIDRLCQEHDDYRWLCGGVSINYHRIADFRTGHVAFLDQLLTDSVAALVHEGLVTLNRVAQAEGAFRIHKSDLSLRPIWHQKQARVQAHVLVCFIAYVLYKMLGQMCRASGLGDEARKVLDEIAAIQTIDVILPTRCGQEIRKRCVAKPIEHQAILLHRLGLSLPRSLEVGDL